MTNPTITETRHIVRLQPELYQKLETKLSRTIVTSSTSAIEVGYQLGVEAVLKELRNGYVMEATT